MRWEIKKSVLYRHEMMMLDFIGTNKFMRDINIMNPSYIQDVFVPIRSYVVQDGMNYKIVPYEAKVVQPVLFDKRDNRYALQTFTEETYDYFINGYKDDEGQIHPLEWGNLNADIYVDPVSINMGTVQRQTFCIAARELIEKGDTVRARKLLDISDANFPESNFPYDKYSVILIDLYYDVYGVERANAIWDSIYKYYIQNLGYYSQYNGTSKASGVKHAIEESCQILYTLNHVALEVLKDSNRSEQVKTALAQQGYNI